MLRTTIPPFDASNCHMRNTALRSFFFVVVSPFSLAAQQTDVLFIGNSYTGVNNLPLLVKNLALSVGDSLNVTMIAPGGYTFQGHTTYPQTTAAIAQGGWEFVVLQEQSQRPSFPEAQVILDVYPYAQALVDSIRVYSPCAEPVFYMTWGRESGDAQNCASWPPVCTYDGMQELLRERYLQMAVDNSASCAPVGAAWKEVRDTQPAIDLYDADGSHPSLAGSYLAACTFYSSFRKLSCAGASFISTLDPVTAATLQNIASSRVLDSLSVWNIGVNDPFVQAGYTDNGSGIVDLTSNAPTATQYLWSFGDGTQSTDPDPQHIYTQNGNYTVTLQVWDDCLRSATVSFTISVVVNGIVEQQTASVTAAVLDGSLRFSGIPGAGRMELLDLSGRIIASHRVQQGDATSLDLPHVPILIWSYFGDDGTRSVGRVVVP